MNQEKRKHPRVLFETDDGLMAVFRIDEKKLLSGSLVTLSREGMGLMISKEVSEKIQEGSLIILEKVIGTTRFELISEIKAEVIWKKDLKNSEMINIGCEFKQMSKESGDQLKQFVNMERKFRGQYD